MLTVAYGCIGTNAVSDGKEWSHHSQSSIFVSLDSDSEMCFNAKVVCFQVHSFLLHPPTSKISIGTSFRNDG